MIWHPEYVTDEDGTTIWFPGHVDPAEFLTGARAQLAEWEPSDPPFERRVEDVAHVWYADDPAKGDDLYPCDASKPGAEPFTEIRFP